MSVWLGLTVCVCVVMAVSGCVCTSSLCVCGQY